MTNVKKSDIPILPKINSSGIFQLKAPFDSLLVQDVWYTCVAVRKMEDMLLIGEDPFKKVYEPHGLEQSDYEEDRKNGICIISVADSANDIKYFPSSYLLSFPNSGGVPYSVMAAVIKLGSVPTSLDLGFVTKRIEDVVQSSLGVTEQAKLIQLSNVQYVSHENSKNLEKARLVKLQEDGTDLTKIDNLTNENKTLKEEIEMLRKFILDNQDVLGDRLQTS